MQIRARGLETELDFALLEKKSNKSVAFLKLCDEAITPIIKKCFSDILAVFFRRGLALSLEESRKFLKDGSLFYQDRSNFEIATPECASTDDLLKRSNTTEANLISAFWEIPRDESLAANVFIELIKKGSDFSAGMGGIASHENYHFNKPDNEGCKDDLEEHLIPFLLGRSPFVGDGHLKDNGQFIPSSRLAMVTFKVSQSSGQRGGKPMIILRRDEQDTGDVDYNNFCRVQVCSSSSNMSSFCTKFRLGTTSIIFRLIEEGPSLLPRIALADPVAAANQAGEDFNLRFKYALKNGEEISLLGINKEYFKAAKGFFESNSASEEEFEMMNFWEEALKNIEHYPSVLDKLTDDRILYKFLTFVLESKYQLSWDDLISALHSDDKENLSKAEKILTKLQWLNLKYFFLTDDSLRQFLKTHGFMDESLLSPRDFINDPDCFQPPADTRAAWRVAAMQFMQKRFLLSQSGFGWGKFDLASIRFSRFNRDPLNSKFDAEEVDSKLKY